MLYSFLTEIVDAVAVAVVAVAVVVPKPVVGVVVVVVPKPPKPVEPNGLACEIGDCVVVWPNIDGVVVVVVVAAGWVEPPKLKADWPVVVV